ncbi:MAG TPA: ATP-dependent RNA helicase [Opitutaceae bacterium]|nr:ATP-dependent RNA helicase [Opitutaceae bacterium]
MPAPRELPIYELESAVVASLRAQGRLIVQAPTGSGKSTQIPQMLLRHGLVGERGEVVVLQPRRLATRMLAKRVAEEVGTNLGDIVGYQIRLESRVSERTRIRFVTEGILLRQMSFDATLRGISAIVFDEFHERHLYGDISLARALQIQQSIRPDLKLIVMSATLDAGALKTYLAPCAVLVSEGRSFPVRIEYLPKTANFEHEPVWDVAARECERVAGESTGDLLVFMPGAYEISRTVQAIQGARSLRDFVCFPLHGELPPEQQDRAVARYESRKIIVSTNVAETSLTIDGVTTVIDCGLARVARFDPHRGINTLLVEKISAASADQRAGRAGRTAPGVCVRLWTEREHGQRAPQELPEVKRLDLSEVVLTLKASGIDDIANFPWLEKPEPKALERAELLLADLGALTTSAVSGSEFRVSGSGREDTLKHDELETPNPKPATATAPRSRITETGRKMLRFPVHPRYARMLLAAQERGCVRSVALMAALTQGRNFLLRGVPKDVESAREDVLGEEHESDFFLLMRAWRYADKANYSLDACRRLGIHAQGARQVGPLFEQFLQIAEKEGLDVTDRRVEGAEIRKCVLAGFSDQLAKRLDGGTLRCELVHNRRGVLARESSIQKATLLVAAEISEIEGRGGEVNVLLSLATAIEEPWLKEIFPDDYREVRGVTYDESMKRVVSRRERRFRDLILEAKSSSDDAPLNEAAALLTKEVVAGRLKLEAWDETVEQWITRVNRLAEWFPELEVNPITDPDRATLIEQICYGELGYRDIKDKPVMPILRDWLTAEQLAVIDDYLPEKLTMANGRRSKLTYAKEGPPVLSARIQELYGIEGKFAVGHGRVPVKIEVLAPNHRPIQVTDDLTNFWREQYPKVKAELSRRYPRHEWR